jgi:hypothetical protein
MIYFKSAVLFVIIIVTFVLTPEVDAKTYQWVDDAGGVHFTDNQDNIPAKFMKRVKEIDSVKDDNTRAPAAAVPKQYSPPPSRPVDKEVSLYGGHDEYYWKSGFTALRDEIGILENGLAKKREDLNQLRRKRIIYKRHSDKAAYNDMTKEIEQDEARLTELQDKLKAFDEEAANAGVPSGWRE